MNIGKAFTYVFEDPDYIKKIGIAALMALIPIAGWLILLGWGVEITRRVIRGQSQPLPEWTDFGALFMQGLKAFGIIFVYVLPILVVNGCVQLAQIPLASQQANDTMGLIIMGLSILSGCLSSIFGIALGLLLPPVLGIFADTGDISAAFRVGDVIALLRANIGAYLLALVGGFLSSIIASLGVIACCIGVFVTFALATAVNAHLHGQAYLAARGAAPRM